MYIVIGLGITGFSVVRYLKNRQLPVMVMDTREAPPFAAQLIAQFPDVTYHFGGFNRAQLLNATEIILSPGIALAHPDLQAAQAQQIPIIGDIELFARAANAPIVAITGTNGKSTVTTMIGELAQAAGVNVAVGGNLGEAALDLLHPDKQLYVLELSSFQLETTFTLAASVAILLNITPDHDDRYADPADYALAKHRIFNQAQLAVYNRNDAATTPKVSIRKQSFGLDAPIAHDLGVKEINGEAQLMCGDEVLFPVATLASKRPNFVNNALAALSVALYFQWPMEKMQSVLHDFKGLAHRCQLIADENGVRWYDDSKATNVGATIAAMQDVGADIQGQQIVLMGGVGKGADFSALGPVALQYARHIILFGEAKDEIARILPAAIARTFVETLPQAIRLAAALAQTGDAVVLAPACASFDMFKDYRDRGEKFVAYVRELLSEKSRRI